jgi:hypothetical protein
VKNSEALLYPSTFSTIGQITYTIKKANGYEKNVK